MINVIVVPETDDYKEEVFQDEVIYINKELGEPNLQGRNAKYIAPFWLTDNKIERVYEIKSMQLVDNAYEIYLGNSYVVKQTWNQIQQTRRFEYHTLESFGFKEVQSGFLLPLD